MSEPAHHHAACACGQLSLSVTGDPAMVSQCHCLACQRRTGSPFAVTAFFLREQVAAPSGNWRTFKRIADSGNALWFHFCETCGSTVFWEPDARPDMLAFAVGAFAEPEFPAPKRSIWAATRHPWCSEANGPSFSGPPS